MLSYRIDNGSSYVAKVCILDIEGNNVTVETSTTINNEKTLHTSIAALNQNKAIVAFKEGFSSHKDKACILNYDGEELTSGPHLVFETSNRRPVSLNVLSPEKAIAIYCDSGNDSKGTAYLLNISGNEVLQSSPVVIVDEKIGDMYSTALSSDKVLVVYRDSYGKGNALISDVDGNEVTTVSSKLFNTSSISHISVSSLTDNKAIVTYSDYDDSGRGKACIMKYDESSISVGPEVCFDDVAYENQVATLFSNKAIIAYRDASSLGWCSILAINGMTITCGNPIKYNNAHTYWNKISVLTCEKAIVAYRDNGNSMYGTVRIFNSKNDYLKDIIGISKECRTSNENCRVAVFDQSTHVYGLTSLISGDNYYVGGDGTLSGEPHKIPPQMTNQIITSVENYIVGVAEDESTLEVIGEYSY